MPPTCPRPNASGAESLLHVILNEASTPRLIAQLVNAGGTTRSSCFLRRLHHLSTSAIPPPSHPGRRPGKDDWKVYGRQSQRQLRTNCDYLRILPSSRRLISHHLLLLATIKKGIQCTWHLFGLAMADSEHFNLAWNQFENCAGLTFKNLLSDEDFADVTLACEGDKQLKAHKVILSSCSPFFRKVLLKNKHQHPLLYLKGVKFTDLQLIVKFIYLGQIEIGKR